MTILGYLMNIIKQFFSFILCFFLGTSCDQEKISDPVVTNLSSYREVFNPFHHFLGKNESAITALDKPMVDEYAGTFELHSMIDVTDSKKASTDRITFNVIEGYDNPNNAWFREKLDTPALQALPENNEAVFQVASNFDCLEGNGGDYSKIMDYLSPGMYVQGEASALSALPGTISRKYFLPKANLLKDFNKKWDIGYSSGYVQEIPKINEWFGSLTDQEIYDAAQFVKVGVQKDTYITGGFGPTRSELQATYSSGKYKAIKVDVAQNQKVTQVFTAALNPYYNDPKTQGFKNLARIFLHAAYRGTLQTADSLKSPKIYLTLIGGGVFANKLEWIAQAIEYELNNSLLKNSKVSLDVNLVIYYSNGYKDRSDYNKAETIFLKLVKQTGGTWTRYKNDGAYHLR
jgi:hypothetical protein